VPSKSEPCGLTQMIAMTYGTLPLVRETGGLRDTVIPYNAETGAGNGFSFANYDAEDLLHVFGQAMAVYKQPEVWRKLMLNGMKTDWSWKNPAARYIELYEGLLV